MEFNGNLILSKKVLNEIDKFVISFVSVLEKYTEYVIVSGFVAIVLGRSRATEDVDLLIPDMDFKAFNELFNHLYKKGFECINTSISKEAFELWQTHAIRFSLKDKPVPNMEFKKIKSDLDLYSLKNRVTLRLTERDIFISPIEMQIASKLFLSSEHGDKDIEDARHIYKLFKEKINKDELLRLSMMLNVAEKLKWLK